MFPFIIGTLAVIVILVTIISNIYVVQQSRAYVIERLGGFHKVHGVGMHGKIPFIDRIARRVSLKEQVLDYPPQPVITKDNVTMQIDTVVYFQITDPKLYAYGVEQPMAVVTLILLIFPEWSNSIAGALSDIWTKINALLTEICALLQNGRN